MAAQRLLEALDALPMLQALCNQLRTLPVIAPIQDAQVFRIGAQIDAGRLGVHLQLRFRKRGKISGPAFGGLRSEEHTSELQSLMRISYAVFCLKKKKKQNTKQTTLSY